MDWWALNKEVRRRDPKSGGTVEANREKNKRTSKEAIDRWIKSRLEEIRNN